MLGVGSVSVNKAKDNTSHYGVRNIQHIIHYILPIFETYPLLTSKYFNYDLFKKAIVIMNDSSLSNKEKDEKISYLKTQCRPDNFISPAWNCLNNKVNSILDAKTVISKSWLIGFTEAVGCFFIIKKGTLQLVHAFEITCPCKLDKIVLEAIALILGLKVKKKKIYITVTTTNSNSIHNIISYYFKTMKGIKALEYRIWARSFTKNAFGGFEYITKIQNFLHNIRSIRLDKNFNKK